MDANLHCYNNTSHIVITILLLLLLLLLIIIIIIITIIIIIGQGAMDSTFHRNEAAGGAPTHQSMRSMIMGYLPPVWIMRKIYGLIFTNLATALLREPIVGSRAVFHVAT